MIDNYSLLSESEDHYPQKDQEARGGVALMDILVEGVQEMCLALEPGVPESKEELASSEKGANLEEDHRWFRDAASLSVPTLVKEGKVHTS